MFRITPTQGLSFLGSVAATATFLFAVSGPVTPAAPRVVATQHVSFALVDNGVVVAKKDNVPVHSGPISLDLVPTDIPASIQVGQGTDLAKVSLEVAPGPLKNGAPAAIQGWVSFANPQINLIERPAKDGKLTFTQVSKVQTTRLLWDMGFHDMPQVLMVPLRPNSSSTASTSTRVLRITLDPSAPAAAAARSARDGV